MVRANEFDLVLLNQTRIATYRITTTNGNESIGMHSYHCQYLGTHRRAHAVVLAPRPHGQRYLSVLYWFHEHATRLPQSGPVPACQ
eukprot:918237-Rhodomonas_salina.1